MKTKTKTKTSKALEFQPFTCCICEREINDQHGNNPEPLNSSPDAECCDQCDDFVHEARKQITIVMDAAKAVVEMQKPKAKRSFQPTREAVAYGLSVIKEGMAFRAWIQESLKNRIFEEARVTRPKLKQGR